MTLRPALVSQAIVVRPDSPLTHVQALRHKTIAVNFHAGSHYLTLQLLEGFMEREAIQVVHVGQAPGRYRRCGRPGRCRDGDGAYIALAEKQGGHVLAEGVYVGAEILSPALDTATATGLYRAITRAVDLINTAKARYLHHLIAEVPPDLGTLIPADFHLPRLRYTAPGRTRKRSSTAPLPGWSVGASSPRTRPMSVWWTIVSGCCPGRGAPWWQGGPRESSARRHDDARCPHGASSHPGRLERASDAQPTRPVPAHQDAHASPCDPPRAPVSRRAAWVRRSPDVRGHGHAPW